MMDSPRHELMTVQEVADYLRIKERKVYDLLAQKRIPCVRVTGKWLFPRAQIDQWLVHSGESQTTPVGFAPFKAPPLVVGSHDPLLEWALREIDSPLGQQLTGSTEGLQRLAAGEAVLCGTHLPEVDSDDYNLSLIREKLANIDVVVIEWARRQQGLIVAMGNPLGLSSLKDVVSRKARFMGRQPGAGGQQLLFSLCARAGLKPEQLTVLEQPARSETDVGLAIAGGKADVGLAVAAVAKLLRLEFLPLVEECFDLVLRRRDYFEPPVQALLAFARSEAFIDKAQELGGYDITRLGTVRYNAP